MTDAARPVRPRRSALFMPASNERAMEKATGLACDVVIMDLEDGVAPDAKKAARARLAGVVRAGGYAPREVMVRINGVGTEWFAADVDAMATSGADTILIPKVESRAAVDDVSRRMARAGAPEDMAIWCMIETARGVLSAADIAGADARLGGLIFGAADLSKDLRAVLTTDRAALVTAMQLVVLAARANGLAVLDTPFFDLSDDDGFRASCAQARLFGFDGKTLIHPRTIADANAAFGPGADELAWARRISAAHAEALKEGKGVTLVDGKLVEGLHVAEAQRLIALADAIATLERSLAG
jgi:citrate lyase subunit beta/citryl-CoA lyase